MTEQKRKFMSGAVGVLTIVTAAAIATLIHSEQDDNPAGTSSAQTDTLQSASPTQSATTVTAASPTPIATTAASAPFVLTAAERQTELDFIVLMIRAGGHMDTNAVLYRPNGQVEGVLCNDGYFSDNPVDVHELAADYAVCDGHGGHRVFSVPIQMQSLAGSPPAGATAGILGTLCADGSVSGSTGRGTCSHHGGEAH